MFNIEAPTSKKNHGPAINMADSLQILSTASKHRAANSPGKGHRSWKLEAKALGKGTVGT